MADIQCKSAEAKVTTADTEVPQGRPLKKCRFVDTHPPAPPWKCKAFGETALEKRAQVIQEKRICPFCLLHGKEEVCYVLI
jgi:formylmethanofuran dehydrogenase subunit E